MAISNPYSVSLLALGFLLASLRPAIAQPRSQILPRSEPSEFHCGGPVEQRVWRLWDGGTKAAIDQRLIRERLLSTGDTYALYDLQMVLGNLVAMADRCQRFNRLVEIADLLLPAFGVLETLPPPNEHHAGWVCRGGSLCTVANKRLGREVLLVSLQGLGLFTDLAARLASQPSPYLQRHPFVLKTASAAHSHLDRMATPDLLNSLQRRLTATPADVKGNSSALLFTSFDIWRYTIAINTAALPTGTWRPSPAVKAMALNTANLFRKRSMLNGRPPARRASIDAGFWAKRIDHAYAGYQGSRSPVVCVEKNGQRIPVPRNPPIPPQPVANMGWDISHSRRLVPLFDAVNRVGNRALQMYDIDSEVLADRSLQAAYANQLAKVIWNQDVEKPLFSNYWSGANGWYRVAYDPGNGSCRLGNPPFGLSSAFAQGGFITWGKLDVLIHRLGAQLYLNMSQDLPENVDWLQRYYPQLAVGDSELGIKQVGKLQFLSSLITSASR